ncbi:hypothetical protein T07_8 [Trichinella nelsoni]|uniref:Uncharacterized protein n=1 Tax=Trichinella nelsoni TaxID=6336 RepID=A0A0V0S615_9BILA|nr:hypothetical protein T07_8 [Trichinella nelsoni]
MLKNDRFSVLRFARWRGNCFAQSGIGRLAMHYQFHFRPVAKFILDLKFLKSLQKRTLALLAHRTFTDRSMHNRRLIIILIAILIGYTHVAFTLLRLWIICHSFIRKDRAKLQLFTALLLKASYGEPLVSFCLPYETALPIGDFCLILKAFIRHEKHPSPEQQF